MNATDFEDTFSHLYQPAKLKEIEANEKEARKNVMHGLAYTVLNMPVNKH